MVLSKEWLCPIVGQGALLLLSRLRVVFYVAKKKCLLNETHYDLLYR